MGSLQERFAQRVRELRLSRGLTQEDLASLANMDFKYISAVEAGKSNITLRNVERIATALGVPAHKLFIATKEKATREDAQVSRLIRLLGRADAKMKGHLIRLLQHHLRLAKSKRK
jgi:transcriptional regulator with XRE-family HTH domain